MTTLYAYSCTPSEPSVGDQSIVSFTTKDNYPHIGEVLVFGDPALRKSPFHILRVEDKQPHALDTLIHLLRFGLGRFDFDYITEAPEVIDKETEIIHLENINACLIDFGQQIVISTIVKPEE